MVDTVTTTVLFTDLVGSTALTTSVAPAEGEALRKAHFAALREVIDGAGGTEVKNLGDGLMAVFPSASRAVSCAVAMQQAVDLHNRASAVALAIRVGVASGEVTADDGDYFGDPVVEASRLCAVAESGQILATQLVRLNAGRHTTAEFSDIGPLTLKGLPEPVAAVAVGWSPAPDDEASDNHRVPLPRRLRVTGPVRFVGRSPERATLAAAWKAASAGATRVVFVAGEAGIGKSRLVAEVAAEAHGNGGIVIYGGCDDGVAVAYRPWREALGHLVTHVDRAVLDAVGDRRLADLGRVLPEVRERIPGLVAPVDSDAETERYLFWSAVAALVAEAGRSTPVLVVLDDLHWADHPSALLFRHVVTVGDCGGVLIVGTYRDGEIGGGHPMADLLAALHRVPGVERIILAGLGDDELVEFVDAAAGAPLGDAGTEFSRALYRETSGNPFFAWEVLRHLAETGVAVHDTGGWATRVEMGDLRLPDSVREVVGQRVARLSPDVQRILSLASVIGDTFDIDLLASVASRSDDVVLDHLETAASAR